LLHFLLICHPMNLLFVGLPNVAEVSPLSRDTPCFSTGNLFHRHIGRPPPPPPPLTPLLADMQWGRGGNGS
jgi:hypothetical protein